MIRRLPVLAVALAASVALSSCSTFDTGVAARVDGVPIGDDAIDLLLTPAETTDTPETTEVVEATGLPGPDARNALTGLIQTRIAQSVAADFGVDLTASRQASREQIEAGLTGERLSKWEALPESSQNLLLDYGAAIDALRQVTVVAPDDLEQLYDDPEQTGFMCLRYMAFKTKQDAVTVDEKLRAGASFADLANELDPQSNGGVVTGEQGAPCVRLDELDPSKLPAEITDALLKASPGVGTGVVQAQYASGPQWFIFLHRPYDEIQDDLAAAVGVAPALAAYYGALTQVGVSVASKYGRWDPVFRVVVALS